MTVSEKAEKIVNVVNGDDDEPVVPTAVATAPYVPPGAPAGGQMVEIKYCGALSWCICIFTCISCVGCCPCDQKELYRAPNGQLYTKSGAIAAKPCFAQGI
ncbi:hypothetical protein TL16_g09898 [Triparma laevis f. inornata]|uniref:Uncharacterized protein n=2 Tax=Triparma laevis TaxID=1534972 RepID=A0A9W7AX72_9STRA|nr:hypothetical protein TrLO_g10305 [Triparma laevis f. longispina]GMH84351.1 hypothetical protein TL16_g09898 [Triparma laevis f. inornata]